MPKDTTNGQNSIASLREQTGLSQSRFARKFHLEVSTLQKWEQGINRTPEYVIHMISTILGYERDSREDTHT